MDMQSPKGVSSLVTRITEIIDDVHYERNARAIDALTDRGTSATPRLSHNEILQLDREWDANETVKKFTNRH